MANKDNEEFKYALREIALKAPNLECPYDRVRCSQWVKKLSRMSGEDIEMGRIRNEYAQLLRIQTRNNYLHGMFKHGPPDCDNLAPLAENLGNMVAGYVKDCSSTKSWSNRSDTSTSFPGWTCLCSCEANARRRILLHGSYSRFLQVIFYFTYKH